MAYADGELDAATCGEIEAALPGDSALARQLTQHRELQNALRAAFAPALDDAVPEPLITAAKRSASHAIEARKPRQPLAILYLLFSWPVPAVVVLAMLLVGVMLGRWWAAPTVTTITTLQGRMQATGALAAALSDQTGGVEPMQSAVVVGLSYLGKGGSYCRTFTIKQGDSIAGLACRAGDTWHIQALAQTGPKSPLAQYRMAGALVPPLILGAVESTIDGSPLDAQAEAAARARGWRQ